VEPEVAAAVADRLGSGVVSAAPVGGGDVAAAFRVELDDGRTVFAKTRAAAPPGFFVTEAEGLRWLRAAGAVAVPEVLAATDDPPLLVLEWIDEGRPTGTTEVELGRGLAALHASGAPCFGREDGRRTGSLSMPNDPCRTWARFYADRRLRPLADIAAGGDSLPTRLVVELRDVADRLESLVGPPEPPARLHGDLWAGNRLVDRAGSNWIVDPAAFGGHREYDLAMMMLFGGFGRECIEAYDAAFPLAAGWEERVPLHQLGPLVVHAVKFGGGYVAAVERALARYV
jgi:fructosamine-3-kinase